MIQLYNYYRSSASFRVRIALNLKELDYQEIPVNLLKGEQHSAEYKAINPQGLVPTLKMGDITLSQSLAIIGYIDELHPHPPLLPKDAYLKAQVRAFALAIAADIHPLNNSGTLQYLIKEIGLSEQQKTAWYQHWVAKGLQALENSLTAKKEQHDFCYGNTPTLADICLVPQLYNARRFMCDVSPYPNLVRVDAHCQRHPAFIKAWPIETSPEREGIK